MTSLNNNINSTHGQGSSLMVIQGQLVMSHMVMALTQNALLPHFLLYCIVVRWCHKKPKWGPQTNTTKLNTHKLGKSKLIGTNFGVTCCKVASQEGSPWVKESVKEWTLTLPRELPFWELESRWTPESSKKNCRGQNLVD